jgi:putative endonuclease
MDTWTVYILNCSDGKLYTGCTHNLDERLIRHKRGEVLATRSRLPVSLLLTITFYDKYKAYEFEKYLKSGSGRTFALRHFV